MRALLKSLLADESGAVLSAEIVMVATVGVLALVAGWNAVSASLAEELGDVANAFGTLNQSYNIKSVNAVGHARCSGHGFNDSDTLVTVTGGGASVAQGSSASLATVGGRAQAAAAAEALVALDVVEVGPAVVEESLVEERAAAATVSAAASADVAASANVSSLTSEERAQLLVQLEAELRQLEAEAARLETQAKSQGALLRPQAEDACELLKAENARLRRLIQELCRQVPPDGRD